ncbi:MAG: hypothetical protein ABSE87_01875 [Terracidiphilus sp.]
MRIGRWAGVLLAVAPFLAGCGDFWQAPSSTGGSGSCTTNCSTATSGYFYILNSPASGSPNIVSESIVSGTLTTLTGSPLTLPGIPYSMSIAPNDNFLCVATSSGVIAYPISVGALGTGVTSSADLDAAAVQVDQSSSWLIEAIPGTGGVTIAAVPILDTTGAGNGKEFTVFIPVTTTTTVSVDQMVISPDNANIFVALGTGGTIVVPFSPGVASGTSPFGTRYTPIKVLHNGGSALSVAVDPTNRLFYIGETLANSTSTSGGLRFFNYSTISELTGSPIATGALSPGFVLPLSSGDYVYVANGTGAGNAGNIAAFAVTSSGTTYSLTAGPTIAVGSQPLGLAEDSTSTFLMEVGSAGSPYFDSFTFDSTTAGQLDTQITSSTATGSIAIVAQPQ